MRFWHRFRTAATAASSRSRFPIQARGFRTYRLQPWQTGEWFGEHVTLSDGTATTLTGSPGSFTAVYSGDTVYQGNSVNPETRPVSRHTTRTGTPEPT
ncbi:hypothetical protein ACWDGI_42965 [Streptomyces sp. NPDC001220]